MLKHEKILERLTGLEGEQFDEAYMGMMVKNHQKMSKLFEKGVNQAENQELQVYAQKTVSVLE